MRLIGIELVDEGLTPALGFSAPNRAYPLSTYASAFPAHLAVGLTVAAVSVADWWLLGASNERESTR